LLDIPQAFDKIWHPGLLYKIKRLFPTHYYNLLKSYLNERLFEVKINEEISNRLPIHSGVPQENLLSPLLYTLYRHDLPTARKTTIGTFADDTAIFAIHDNPVTASSHLQEHLSFMEAWLNKWKIKVNESKSTQTTFTLLKDTCPPVQINHINIPLKEQVKYLGLTFDYKLNWRQHIIKERKQMDQKIEELNWLIGKKSHLSIDNKLLLYKTVMKSIWTYGIELWGCASKSNIAIIQRAQSKILRSLTNAPFYVSNLTLHKDLKIPYVTELIKENSPKYFNKLENHSNPLLQPLLQPHENRRLKRIWPSDLRK
jgi:hypothetical protein